MALSKPGPLLLRFRINYHWFGFGLLKNQLNSLNLINNCCCLWVSKKGKSLSDDDENNNNSILMSFYVDILSTLIKGTTSGNSQRERRLGWMMLNQCKFTTGNKEERSESEREGNFSLKWVATLAHPSALTGEPTTDDRAGC